MTDKSYAKVGQRVKKSKLNPTGWEYTNRIPPDEIAVITFPGSDANNSRKANGFAKAIQNGAEMAYKAVTVPKEGTILTIIRAMAEKSKQAVKAKSFEEFFTEVLSYGEETLQRTPDMLPVLKKAGMLTRDARAKERKKYGLKAARRAPQFSKR